MLGTMFTQDSMSFLHRSGIVSRLFCGPRIVYPLDFVRMGVARWNFLLVCVWLVHMVMTNHFGAQVVP